MALTNAQQHFLHLLFAFLFTAPTVLALQHHDKRDDDENMPGLRGTEALRNVAHIAHGTVMSIAIVLLFPLGSIMLRLFHFRNLVWFHAAWQIFSLLVLITGFALGTWLSVLHNEVWNKCHEQFGTVIFLLFLAQPLLGLLTHHFHTLHTISTTAKDGSATRGPPPRALCLIHTNLGRVLIILGVINGGLGLQLGANTTAGEIVYGCVAGFVGLVYAVVLGWWYLRRRRTGMVSGGETGDGDVVMTGTQGDWARKALEANQSAQPPKGL